jgi:virginiamycin B lyase
MQKLEKILLRGLVRIDRRTTVVLVAFTLLIMLMYTDAATASSITEWNISSASFPRGLAVDTSSNVWFAEFGKDSIGKLSYGTYTGYSLPPGSHPIGILYTGDVWFTESATNRIGKLTMGGHLTEYTVGNPSDGVMDLWGIACNNTDSGRLRIWFTSPATSKVGLLMLKGGDAVGVKYWNLPGFNESPSSMPRGIVYSPNTGPWFVDYNLHRIGNIPDPSSSSVREWQLADGSYPFDIALDASGNVWFTESGRSRIGMLNPRKNAITEYLIPTSNASPYGIAVDYSDDVWFAEYAANKIGRLNPETNITTEFTRSESGTPWGVTTERGGTLSIYFSDPTSNKIGRLSPLEGVTSTTSKKTSGSSSASRVSTATSGHSSSITTTHPSVSRTETGTTSTINSYGYGYVNTTSLTLTGTQTLTTTTYVATTRRAIPAYTESSILIGLSLGATFLILSRRIAKNKAKNPVTAP